MAIIYSAISLAVGEVHPFTTLPMYCEIPDVNTVYFLEDNEGKTIPLINVARVPSAFINKLHTGCANKQGFESGEVTINSEAFKRIGECVYLKTVVQEKVVAQGLPYLQLVMLHCDSKDNSSHRVILHEARY